MSGQRLKSIRFKLPIIENDLNIGLDNDEHIETVCLMSDFQKQKESYINSIEKRQRWKEMGFAISFGLIFGGLRDFTIFQTAKYPCRPGRRWRRPRRRVRQT